MSCRVRFSPQRIHIHEKAIANVVAIKFSESCTHETLIE
jgi:hypothetical protein